MMFTLAIFGGILLNVGAYFMFKGWVFRAIVAYLFADICWVIMAWQKEDLLGALFISSGMLLGFLAFLKMRSGKMHKSLNTDESHEEA
jgi:nucleoside permease NupC